jgi:hypothetical protein
MMYRPSGVHTGLFTCRSRSRVTWRRFCRPTSIVQRFSSPSRSLVKAMRRPSGLKRGCVSYAVPAREQQRRLAALDRHQVDVAEQVEDDLRPSGLTSTDIQVPSSVSNCEG